MGAKKNKGRGENKNNDQQKKSDGDGGKKFDGTITVVLKMDLHCAGCITKYRKAVGSLNGVESVKADLESNKLTVVGNVDPAKVRDMLEQKAKKKVEIISPAPKKENEGGGGGAEGEKKSEVKTQKNPDEKKAKEPPSTTAILKLNLHCEGCIKKIYKTVTKTHGYHEIRFDREKDLVTVKGTMDMKALAESLKEKLKRNVEVVPPKKDGDGGGKKEQGGGGGGGGKEKGGANQGNAAGDGSGSVGDGAVRAGENRIQQFYPDGYGSPIPVYRHLAPPPPPPPGQPGWGYPNPPGFVFSDENPLACSVM